MLAPGTRLGDRYVLCEPVAHGGMGEVWRANDPVLSRPVAVKVLLPSLSGEPGFAERFRTEARAMAALSDPSIVEVYDYGQAGGIAYLVMPFVEGESLHELLNRVGPLPPREAMTIVAQAANALRLAHRSGIVHGDVKPGNLRVRPDGRLVLTDFGIARVVAADQVTAADGLMGTAAYLAPEQLSGGRATPATDVYALGVVAYECLTMTRPFVADVPVGVAHMHSRDEPPPLPDTIPPAVQRVVMRALAKDPEQRWPSADAMAEAATDAARELPAARSFAESPELATAGLAGARSSRFAVPAAPQARHPAPTAALPTILNEPRSRGRPWAWLIPIAAGVALAVAATAIAVSRADTPSGIQVPPASSVAPGEGTLGTPQQTDPAKPGNATPGNATPGNATPGNATPVHATTDDRGHDGRGGNSGPGGGGSGGGGGGSGGTSGPG